MAEVEECDMVAARCRAGERLLVPQSIAEGCLWTVLLQVQHMPGTVPARSIVSDANERSAGTGEGLPTPVSMGAARHSGSEEAATLRADTPTDIHMSHCPMTHPLLCRHDSAEGTR